MKTLLAASLFLAAFVPALAFASVSINLIGPSPVTVSQGHPFVEPGYTALSTVDGDISGSVSLSNVDTSIVGQTTRSYFVTDSVLDSASVNRQITVVGGGSSELWCSSPTAPGYNVSLPGGGCASGSTIPVYFRLGEQTTNRSGILETCMFFSGCIIK